MRAPDQAGRCRREPPRSSATQGDRPSRIRVDPPPPEPRAQFESHSEAQPTSRRKLIGAYLSALPRLTPGPVRAAIAAVMANDAQHLSVLRAAQHRSPVPAAFVTAGE